MGFEGRTLTGGVVYNGITRGFYNEYPKHKVTLTRDFYIGVYEVNRHQWSASDASTKSMGWITWQQANAFCDTLTAHDPNGWKYRLPTEAEWEYCCRAGTSTWFYTGDAITTSQANIVPGWGAVVDPAPVGGYAPNPWGLYDMAGNAEEWCLDWLAGYKPDSLVNPGGPSTGSLKCIRSLGHYDIYVRTVARGGVPPALSPDDRKGLRIVISDLTKDSLNYYPNPDTLQHYQKRITQSRTAPLTAVSGETYQNSEGLSFKRVRMTRAGFPMQKDSVVYVSLVPVAGDSGTSRGKAGLYAARLSATYGVLYRISNRYELGSSGLTLSAGYYLTILPDIRFQAGDPHPDRNWFQARHSSYIPTPSPVVGGPVFYDVNHNSFIGECPNGDLIASWYSGTTEDCEEQVTAGCRLRLGENKWDSLASQMVDYPGYADYSDVWRDNGKGVLYNYHTVTSNLGGTWFRKSLDNGVTWSTWTFAFNGQLGKSMFQLGRDTLVDLTDGGGCVARSVNNGDTWLLGTNGAGGGYHTSCAILDNGTIVAFQRGVTDNNDSGAATMHKATTTTLGQAGWTPAATPFWPPQIGQYDVCLKLQSGRLLMATVCLAPAKEKVVLAESEDSGKTWFCRRTLAGLMDGYKDMCQGRDGVIHLQGTKGSGAGQNGNLPQVSFTERWLQEGTCVDIGDWGINTTGAVAPCPPSDGIGTVVETEITVRLQPALSVSPNPFYRSTVIRFGNLRGSGTYMLHDVSGRLIRSWTVGRAQASLVWNGTDETGKSVAAGIYVGTLRASGEKTLCRRMLLAK
jgi:hypothetical protein